MEEITELLDRILAHLTRLGRPVCSLLQPGLSEADIRSQAQALPYELPASVQALYRWRNGTGTREGAVLNDLYFIPGSYFLPLEGAVITYAELVKPIPDSVWDPSWIPIFDSGGADLHAAIGCTAPCEDNEIVWAFCGIPPMVAFESLLAMLRTIKTAYEQGVIFVDSKGALDQDDDRFGVIARQYNPSIEYWR